MNPGTKSFRQTKKYKRRFEAFGDTLRAHLELKDAGKAYEGLEPLMVEAFRFMSFLRKEGHLTVTSGPDPRPIDTAILETMSILDEPLESCMPLHYEADALECLSKSAWKLLKEKEIIKHCKYCQEWLYGSCKKHKKQPESVDDLFFCKKCHGWLDNVCVVHGPEANI